MRPGHTASLLHPDCSPSPSLDAWGAPLPVQSLCGWVMEELEVLTSLSWPWRAPQGHSAMGKEAVSYTEVHTVCTAEQHPSRLGLWLVCSRRDGAHDLCMHFCDNHSAKGSPQGVRGGTKNRSLRPVCSGATGTQSQVSQSPGESLTLASQGVAHARRCSLISALEPLCHLGAAWHGDPPNCVKLLRSPRAEGQLCSACFPDK